MPRLSRAIEDMAYPTPERAIEDMAYPTPEVLYCCGIVMSRRFPREKGFIPVFLRMLRDMLSLKRLDLEYNEISAAGAASLAAALATSKLTELHLYFNQISDAGAVSLAAALPTSKLTVLDIGGNQISAAGKAQLRQAARECEVKVYRIDVIL